MTTLRKAHEAVGRNVLEPIVPAAIAGSTHMTRTVPPEVIPAMTALMAAAALNLSPSLWRDQFGPWRPEEM